MKQTAYLQSCVLLVAVIRLAAGEWDFIVVGAGASGCTIAPELAATGKKVLLLEAGGNTGWAFGGKDQQAVFGKLKSSTVFDVPGENERLRQNPENWWSNLPWGFNGKCNKLFPQTLWLLKACLFLGLFPLPDSSLLHEIIHRLICSMTCTIGCSVVHKAHSSTYLDFKVYKLCEVHSLMRPVLHEFLTCNDMLL